MMAGGGWHIRRVAALGKRQRRRPAVENIHGLLFELVSADSALGPLVRSVRYGRPLLLDLVGRLDLILFEANNGPLQVLSCVGTLPGLSFGINLAR